jgi:heat shock protein HspQ
LNPAAEDDSNILYAAASDSEADVRVYRMTAEIAMRTAGFPIGQVVYHKLFGYRGVIYDVDLEVNGEQEWYERAALARPSKDQP